MARVVDGSRAAASGTGAVAVAVDEEDASVAVGAEDFDDDDDDSSSRRDKSCEMAQGTDMYRGGSKILRPLRGGRNRS